MKNFLIEFFRPLDNLIFNYLVKIGGIQPFWEALIGAGVSLIGGRRKEKQAKETSKKSQEQIESAFEQIRDPIDIILEAYGPEGLYSEEVMGKILGAEAEYMGPMTDLLKQYGQTMAFGEGGLDELSKQTTESILNRMQTLGPEFREALEDPRLRSLVEDQIENFKTSYAQTEANSAERESVAKEFDAGLKDSLTRAGVSLDAIQRAETKSAQPFLERAKTFGEGGFLGDIRGLTDIEKAEAKRLTEEARGPLGFEAIRRAEQTARAEGGALGRDLDASAIARAALGREEQVMAREDRAAAARERAAQLAGLGGKLDLSAIGLGAEIGMGLDKLGLAKEELSSTQAMNLAQLQGLFGAQARADAMAAREEGRAGFRDVFEAAGAMSVDPSSIFLGEAAPAFNLYSSILSQKPGTIFTDPGFALNIGSQFDTTQADILLGGAGISASQAAGGYKSAGDLYGTASELLGGIDFGKIFS